MGGNCYPFGREKFHLPFAYVTLWVQLKRKKIKHEDPGLENIWSKNSRAVPTTDWLKLLEGGFGEGKLSPAVSRLAFYAAGHLEVSRCCGGQKAEQMFDWRRSRKLPIEVLSPDVEGEARPTAVQKGEQPGGSGKMWRKYKIKNKWSRLPCQRGGVHQRLESGLQRNQRLESRSLIRNAGWARWCGLDGCFGSIYLFVLFCFLLLRSRSVCVEEGEKEGERLERRAVPRSGPGGWSVEGHFVPRLIFVFTWHGRKLPMKGGTDYCLINTELEGPHLLKRIRWFECVGDPTAERDPTLGPDRLGPDGLGPDAGPWRWALCGHAAAHRFVAIWCTIIEHYFFFDLFL